MGSILPKNHYVLSASSDVIAICEPLSKYGINSFNYMRCYDDGKSYILMTNKEAAYHHVKQELLIAPPINANLFPNNFYYYASPADIDKNFNKAVYDYSKLFNLGQPFYFFERHKGYVDLFVFVSTPENLNIINFYLNNIDILENFKKYFKEKANRLIKRASKNYLILPEHMRLNFGGIKPNDEVTKNINLLKSNLLHINSRLQLHLNTTITSRELQTLSYLLKGRTAMETSEALEISPKTVEYYIDSVKAKLGCLSRASLFDKALELDLINLIIKI